MQVRGLEPRDAEGPRGWMAEFHGRSGLALEREAAPWVELLRAHLAEVPRFDGPVTCQYLRSYRAAPLTPMSLRGSASPILAALRRLRVIGRDSPTWCRVECAQEPRGARGPFFLLLLTAACDSTVLPPRPTPEPLPMEAE